MKQKSEFLQEIKDDEATASGVCQASAVNDGRTSERIDTLLTRLGSLDVPAPMPRGPLVYFVRRGDEVKIGFTHRLSQRMAGLGGGDLQLLGTVPGTTTTERMYHQRLDHLRVHGEWFRADRELLDIIDTEAEPPPAPRPGYKEIAQAYVQRSRKNLGCGDAKRIFGQTQVGFWLNMLANGGETSERLAGLEDALSKL